MPRASKSPRFVDDAAARRVVGDATRLRQVLLNLVGNAIKFTETGGVAIEVEPTPDGALAFRIRDTGIGIAPELQARIFEEFEQAEGGAGRRFGGTGLGLAISKRLVEAMGGEISLDSTPGQGATFTCTIALPPTETAAADAAADTSSDLRRNRRADRGAGADRGSADGAAASRLGREDEHRRHPGGGRAIAPRRPLRCGDRRRCRRPRHGGADRRIDPAPRDPRDRADRTARSRRNS